ncbi:MAG: hypothetical protein LBG44_05760 [Gemmatimonadota bacterium]|jgi:hypothetical protein|nr:hypothetical protein [Gemmatimonadota bacterium]
MATKNNIDVLKAALGREAIAVMARLATPEQQREARAQTSLATITRSIGKQGNLLEIVAAENAFVLNEKERHANSSGMKASLEEALKDLSRIDRGIGYVTDPVKYRIVDSVHDKPEHRISGVPKDEARQGFTSQHARLQNLGKSRLSAEEKGVLSMREANLKIGGKLYGEMQRKALRIVP